MDDTTGGPELQRVDRARRTAAARAKRAVRHWMIACGAACASGILLAGVLNRLVSNSWLWVAVYSVSLFLIVKVLRRLDDLATVHAKPSRRAAWIAMAASIAGPLAVLPFLHDGFGAYAVSAAIVLGTWTVLGWWASR